ncbi:MAG: polysaccharide biosynthesis/export family protein, partial [Planctomycetaceae bacterium]|nr:polysaccharide biosynthesis/export family protein [Planctomycetaceae bacterium]
GDNKMPVRLTTNHHVTDSDASGLTSSGPSDARDALHSIALVRRPTWGGRVALLLAVLLGIGPAGTYLFRVTQAIFAGEDAAEQSSASDGLSPMPVWDLTQPAKDAWMVVELPARSEVKTDGSSSLPKDSAIHELPVLDLTPRQPPVQLVHDSVVQESFHFEAPANPHTAAPSASGPAPSRVVPVSNEFDAPEVPLTKVRPNVQSRNDRYLFESVPAPVAPPANSDATPVKLVAPPPPFEDLFSTPSSPDEPLAETTHPVVLQGPTSALAFETPTEAPAPPADSILFPADRSTSVSDPFTTPQYVSGWGTCPPGVQHRCGVHCNGDVACRDLRWRDSWLIPWEVFAQGEYIGPSRTPHVPEYRLRVDDQIEFVFRLTGEKSAQPYRINTGDVLSIESLTAESLNREVLVQPDGTVSLIHLGQVLVAGRTIEEVRSDLESKYSALVRSPSITVTPTKMNTVLEELRATVDSRYGNGGQSRLATVTPAGTVQLPAIGSVPAHGLTLDELQAEIHYRYNEIVNGLEVTPILHQRAPRYVFILGEVRAPGRYSLDGPTSLMQAIAIAGGWNVGANLTEVVVFRRDENWQLMATKVGIRRPLYGKDPCPDGELWLRDSDIVVVPKSPILVVDEFIDLVFTRGVYGVIPFSSNMSYVRSLNGAATVIPVP